MSTKKLIDSWANERKSFIDDIRAKNEIVRVYADKAFHMLGYSELAPQCEIIWNSRLKTTLGRAYWKDNKIELGLKAKICKVDEPFLRELVYHEVAHITTNNDLQENYGHGAHWKESMRILGYPAARSCNFDVPAELKQDSRVRVTCRCREGCLLGPIQFKKLVKKKQKYVCRKCRNYVVV